VHAGAVNKVLPVFLIFLLLLSLFIFSYAFYINTYLYLHLNYMTFAQWLEYTSKLVFNF